MSVLHETRECPRRGRACDANATRRDAGSVRDPTPPQFVDDPPDRPVGPGPLLRRLAGAEPAAGPVVQAEERIDVGPAEGPRGHRRAVGAHGPSAFQYRRVIAGVVAVTLPSPSA